MKHLSHLVPDARAPVAPPVTVNLVGPMRITGPGMADLTPSSAKALGLVALVATAPGLRRSRAWLQDKLWSESPPEQGASNLRQAVLRLRHALRPHSDVVTSERGWLGLDARLVRIVADPSDADLRHESDLPEFCEGLDIADPEFEDWIRDARSSFLDRAEEALEAQRARRSAGAAPAPAAADLKPVLLLGASEAGSPTLRALAEVLLSDVAAQVASFGAADVVMEQADGLAPLPERAYRLRVRAAEGPGGSLFRVQLEDCRWGTMLRNVGRTFPRGRERFAESDVYHRLVSEAAHVIAHELGRLAPPRDERQGAWALGYRALGLATSFSLAAHREGDRLLAAACETYPAPAFLAWRGYFRVAAIIERHLPDPRAALEEATELASHALERDPFNALILSVKSDVLALLGNRGDDALELARRAVETDPANVYARVSFAYRMAWTDDRARAHVEARRALQLASGTTNSALWWMMCCMTATRCGRYREAVRFGEEAHRRAPEFRPPLRYLGALHYHLGDAAAALECLRKLKRLEPDFSAALFRGDSYPVETLRKTPLIAVAESRLI